MCPLARMHEERLTWLDLQRAIGMHDYNIYFIYVDTSVADLFKLERKVRAVSRCIEDITPLPWRLRLWVQWLERRCYPEQSALSHIH